MVELILGAVILLLIVWIIKIEICYRKNLAKVNDLLNELIATKIMYFTERFKQLDKFILETMTINDFVNIISEQEYKGFEIWLKHAYPNKTAKDYVRMMKNIKTNSFNYTNLKERRVLDLYRNYLTGKDCIRKK